jgi:hypothetical protein
MMKGKFAYLFLGVIIVIAVVIRLFSVVAPKKNAIPENKVVPLVTVIPTSTPAAIEPDTSQIIIKNPQPGMVVTSPLELSGEARGNWFFEASLPVKLLDENGQTIASVPASAKSDWQTDNLVPFSATLEFTTTSTSGYLLITKDNPSGLPENDASMRISVRFK